MTIRKTTPRDLDAVMGIYAYAREQMALGGNPHQWGDAYPPREMIEADIRAGFNYVCEGTPMDGLLTDGLPTDGLPGGDPSGMGENGDSLTGILAVFYFNIEVEPTYTTIDGAWLDPDTPYGVVHRIARGPDGKGTGAFCLEWCLTQWGNIRIDTHAANGPMLALLPRLGYTRCGIIRLGRFEDAALDERVAFQKLGLAWKR